MSWQAQEAARRHSRARGGARMLLFAIASYAGPDGSGAFPGLQQLCEDTKLSERAVRYCLRKLEVLGEVETIIHGGPHGANRYRVTLVEVDPPSPGAKNRARGGAKIAGSGREGRGGGAISAPGANPARVGQSATQVGQPVAPYPSVDPSEIHQARGGMYIARPHPRARFVSPPSRPRARVWAALVREADSPPVPGAEHERWTATWRNLQDWGAAAGLDDAGAGRRGPRPGRRYRAEVLGAVHDAGAGGELGGAGARPAARPEASPARASPGDTEALIAAQPPKTRAPIEAGQPLPGKAGAWTGRGISGLPPSWRRRRTRSRATG
jgi:hypothetical protein